MINIVLRQTWKNVNLSFKNVKQTKNDADRKNDWFRLQSELILLYSQKCFSYFEVF